MAMVAIEVLDHGLLRRARLKLLLLPVRETSEDLGATGNILQPRGSLSPSARIFQCTQPDASFRLSPFVRGDVRERSIEGQRSLKGAVVKC